MNLAFKIVLAFCAFFFAKALSQKATDSFTISSISSSRPYNEAFATSEPRKEELEKALDQKYTYFRRGGQAFVFLSEDGEYVIKFLKQRMFRPSWLLNHLPLPRLFRDKRNWKRLDKLKRDFKSYKFAFEELHDQTGMLYLHLNPTTHLQKKLSITDRLNISHQINLDQFDFIVQKRAKEVNHYIETLMNQNRIQEAKKAIKDLIALIPLSEKKGYRDRDPDIQTNCGFIGDQAVKIDVGRFLKKDQRYTKTQLENILEPFETWIKERHPTLLSYFQEVKGAYTK